MIRRFDEILCTMASKIQLKELEKRLVEEFVLKNNFTELDNLIKEQMEQSTKKIEDFDRLMKF